MKIHAKVKNFAKELEKTFPSFLIFFYSSLRNVPYIEIKNLDIRIVYFHSSTSWNLYHNGIIMLYKSSEKDIADYLK